MMMMLLCRQLSAQDCTVHHYGVNDGLSQSSVWHFFEDKNGMMWIGTGDGLNLFDGYHFTIFKNDPLQQNSLSNNRIRSINQDSYNRIWVGTDEGLNVYDDMHQKFKAIVPVSREFPDKAIRVCHIIDTKLFFYAPGRGTFSYSTRDQNIAAVDTRYNMLERINETAVINNCLWFISTNKLCRFNLKTAAIDQYKIGTGEKNLDFTFYCRFDDSHILIAENQGPVLFNTVLNKEENLDKYPALLSFQNKKINAFCIDLNSKYWIAVQGDGLYCYDKNGSFLKYYHDENPQVNSSVSFRDIRTIYPDSKGNIWVGTDDAGFFKISSRNEKFNLTNVNTGNGDHIGSNFIKCFYKSGNNLWVGTYKKGLNIINTRTGKIRYYYSKENDNNSLYSNTISAIYPDREGNIWVISEDGLCIYDSAKQIFKRISYFRRKSPDNFTPVIFEKKNGEKWVRLENGLSRLIYEKGNWRLHLFSDTIYPTAIWENDNGDCFLSTTNRGVLIWRDGKFESLSHKAHWPENLSLIIANCFAKDSNKNTWIGTRNGLMKLDENDKFIKLYTTIDGLPDNFIYGILRDKYNRLWMSTNKGLSCFNITTHSFRNYGIADGLQSNEFNTGAYYEAADGEMFFGGVNGFNNFYPKKINNNPNTPVLRLTDIKLFDVELAPEKRVNDARFSYNQNTFSFIVSGIEFSRPEDNTYAFMLEGNDNSWFYSGTKREVRFDNLSPGHYALWVKSANADGVWSAPVSIYSFTINPPFWKTWWFLSLLFILFIGSIILVTINISQQKLKKLLAKTEKEREIEKIRSRISSDIHDDIGAGLSRIALISDKVRNDKGSSLNIDNQLDKLSKSSRELMSSLGEIVWAMNPKNDELSSLLSYLRSYANGYFEDSDIVCIVNFQDPLPDLYFNPEIRRNIFLIIKEAFNNTLKYARANTVNLTFGVNETNVVFEIKDNGVGIDPLKIRQFSNGMSNMRKRCEDIGGVFELTSIRGSGTAIRLLIDLKLVES